MSHVRLVFVLILSTGVLLVGFNNCSKTDFSNVGSTDSKSSALGAEDPAPVAVVSSVCASSRIGKVRQRISFPNPMIQGNANATCGWGVGSNGVAATGAEKFTARAEQIVPLDLPAGAVICDLQFMFPQQSIRYDDQMALMYDDVVLAATTPLERFLSKDGTMFVYDWSKLRGNAMSTTSAYTYCLGAENGRSSCQWPRTQTTGNMSLNFAATELQAVTARNLEQAAHTFTMVTFGDNDPSSDCQHSPIAFDVDITFGHR